MTDPRSYIFNLPSDVELDRLPEEQARLLLENAEKKTRVKINATLFDFYRSRTDADRDALFQACAESEQCQEIGRAYISRLKARRKEANLAKDAALKAEARERKAKSGHVAPPKRPQSRVNLGLLKKNPPVIDAPETIRETRHQRAVGSQLGSRGNIVHIDTGNVEYRLKEPRWQERSKRHG